jgi:hypothetical protein
MDAKRRIYKDIIFRDISEEELFIVVDRLAV